MSDERKILQFELPMLPMGIRSICSFALMKLTEINAVVISGEAEIRKHLIYGYRFGDFLLSLLIVK